MKWDKYLLVAVSNNFLVNFSYIFENVKKLSDRKFDIFFSVIPLSRSETMAILASSGKVPFDIFFFWQKTIAAIFTSLGGFVSRPTDFFVSSVLKSLNIYFAFVLEKLFKDVSGEIWYLGVVLIWVMLEWSKHDWTIKSIACIVSEMLLSWAKGLWWYELNISANTDLSVIVSLSVLKIISSVLIWLLFVRKGFIMFPKILFVTPTSFKIFLKYFLCFLCKRHTFVSLYYVSLYLWFIPCLSLSDFFVRVIMFATLTILPKDFLFLWISISLIQDVQVSPGILRFFNS